MLQKDLRKNKKKASGVIRRSRRQLTFDLPSKSVASGKYNKKHTARQFPTKRP